MVRDRLFRGRRPDKFRRARSLWVFVMGLWYKVGHARNHTMRRRARRGGGRQVELVVEGLGARGDGFASLDGRPVFVPFTVPGDRGRARQRSEERRVGEECRTRGAPDPLKKKKKQLKFLACSA